MKPFTTGRKISTIILLIVGGAIVGYGFYLVVTGDTSYEKAEKESSIPTMRHARWLFSQIMTLPDNKTKIHIETDFRFQTREVFAVDNPINYTITSTVYDYPNIKYITWFFDNDKHDFAKMYGNIPDQAVSVGEAGDIIANLTQRDPHHDIFEKTGTWNDTVAEQVTMYGIAFTNDNSVIVSHKTAYPMGNSNILFTVDSPVAILQAQTDRDLISQSHESDKTNSHVEGLTWIIIGLIPIGIVGEIVVERWWVG